MKRSIFLLMIFFSFSAVAPAATSEKVTFGPVKYDVKERYGKDNVYKDSFKATEGLYVIKLQNGSQIRERSDFIDFTVNGEKLLKDNKYDYGFIACIVNLQKENTFELLLKDAKPSGFKRPVLPPRFVTMTVMPFTGKLPRGAYGVDAWENLNDIAGLLQKIGSAESASLAVSVLNLQKDVTDRAEAMRKLSDRKDVSAQPFIIAVYSDGPVSPDIRGEAALALGALGDKNSIPLLMNGVLDPEEKTRLGSTRALSFYKEEDTREQLTKMLERLDTMRRDAVIRSIVNAGWKPVGTLMTLAESNDPHVSSTAVRVLGASGDPRATELLLKLFEQPGPRDIREIITALGETKDNRAIEPLTRVAKDRAKRAGKEAELGEALADLGDQKSADVILEMMKKADSQRTFLRLQQAYKKLTGKENK